MTGTHIDELLTEITGSPRRPLHRVMGDDTRIATLGQEMNDFVAAVGGGNVQRFLHGGKVEPRGHAGFLAARKIVEPALPAAAAG